jgi:predicted RNA-binding Zn-ribbon protein involved in translation (DUF1610 family)
MERSGSDSNQSVDFLCPSCGASAFEVVGGQADDETLLVMQCLKCMHEFWHRCESGRVRVGGSDVDSMTTEFVNTGVSEE